MGYKRERRTYNITLEDEPGLEIKLRSVSTGKYLELSRLTNNDDSTEADEKMVEEFSKALISWNLDDEDGIAVPATLEGVSSQDFDFTLTLIMAWMEAIAGTNPPLKENSPSGEQSLEAGIPMETRLPNLAS